MRYLIWRSSPLLLTVADLWRVRSYSNGIWYVLITDGLALILIRFAPEIDDLTFGLGVGPSWMSIDKINVHTPPFLIAFLGWIVLLFNTAMLFFTHWIEPLGRH